MTAAGSPPLPAPSRPTGDDYADVTDMFRLLRALPADSSDFTRERDRIITRCLPLADRIAQRYHGKGESIDDLRQIARVGLLHAVNRFDPNNGAAFLSYAVPTILGEVRRYFRDHSWAMRVPRRLKDLHVRIGQITPQLTQSLGHAPSPRDLATALDVSQDEVVECLIAASSYSLRSLDVPTSEQIHGRSPLGDTFGELDRELDAITDRESLRPHLEALTDRQRAVLNLRFFAGMTQSQIAEEMGCSQMHVSRILAATLRQLRRGVCDGTA
ncbi:RNA polymerase sigma-70 factor, sigma-B/F/G subfamily (plasmid) [Mycolicibacterium chubuense NBB4]|uniref:RNA polymerase sigma-70 factor, sigma-B/F/G subfamily n=1 Tax=Mycolicibacterium chubuense (strain NBB4) TaxID=710421 RepID=I4BSK2_MYCCN|nr:SigB/SigF/SigG family RNA polymerase sigma factor [Mycolicibacterium chubuense]AFM20259.1 RNA polymerase sigma-70 factor, sigma-B/F/G subfamily [Mycolicibacterium chubuense NBB4]